MSDGFDPAPCSQDLFENGIELDVIGEIGGSNRFERLIQAASRYAGVAIDWHFAGGRAVVLCYLKDVDKASDAMQKIVYPVLYAPEGTFEPEVEKPYVG